MHYEDLLDAAREQPEGADYHTLRMAYVRSDVYFPYRDDTEDLNALGRALHAGEFETALEVIDHMLAQRYLDIEAHMAADFVHLRLGDEARSAFHRAFAQGLLAAIRATGDGQRFESAYIVIDVPEEYTLLRTLGLRATGQATMEHDGQWFDVLTAEDTRTGQASKVHFNIDLPRRWLDGNVSRLDYLGD